VDYTIVAHQKTAAVFRNRPTIFKGQSEETGSTWESYSDAIGMRWAPPDITFSDRMSLHWGGPEVVLEYHPGPTAGSIWVIIPAEKVVFVGDTVVMDQPPFLASADPTAWLESLDLLLDQYASYNIVSGRGGLASAGVIRQTQHFIKETNRCVERLARRNIAPETTEELIPTLLPLIPFPPERQERYTQRIRYGLHQYFIRRYRPATSSEQSTPEDEEQ
jgi:glyoxylase-like metal-dependent hydrolase (beta-lactamase superfamily II)